MRISVKNIHWQRHPKLHAEVGYIESQYGERKVAMLVNENNNPRRPAGGVIPAKPFTLEVYIPLLSTQDKVLKFTREAEAKAEAARLLARFIADTTEQPT
jgi:hypothetical protein